MSKVFNKLYAFGVRLANIGVHDGMSFHEKKKNQVINLCICCGMIPKLYFGTINLLHQKYLLVGFNLFMILGGIAILIIHSYRKYTLARMILIVAGSIVFGLGAIFYRNGGEYFLLANLIIIIIFFTETKYIVGTSLYTCALFIGIKIFLNNSSFNYDTVPFNRVMFNITWALLLVSLALWFFKTEQLSYLKEIERKNRELEKINQTKEKLFSIIAHDLRSPIAQLKGSLDLLNHEYISPEKFSEMALRISDHVDQLHNTLDNLLRWSLSQLQGITAHPEKTELASIINDRFSILQQKMEEKNINLVINDLQQTVWVDPDHLRLIVRNLLSNAIKYSYRNGNILVTSRSENNLVTLIIEDHGIGMSEGMKKDIFHPDIIYSKPGTENEKGTGLGLRLCKEFVEKNNGRISVESEENMGSRFFVSLPAAIAEYTD